MMCKHCLATAKRLVCFYAILVTNNEFGFDNFFTLTFPVTIKLTRLGKKKKNQKKSEV